MRQLQRKDPSLQRLAALKLWDEPKKWEPKKLAPRPQEIVPDEDPFQPYFASTNQRTVVQMQELLSRVRPVASTPQSTPVASTQTTSTSGERAVVTLPHYNPAALYPRSSQTELYTSAGAATDPNDPNSLPRVHGVANPQFTQPPPNVNPPGNPRGAVQGGIYVPARQNAQIPIVQNPVAFRFQSFHRLAEILRNLKGEGHHNLRVDLHNLRVDLHNLQADLQVDLLRRRADLLRRRADLLRRRADPLGDPPRGELARPLSLQASLADLASQLPANPLSNAEKNRTLRN